MVSLTTLSEIVCPLHRKNFVLNVRLRSDATSHISVCFQRAQLKEYFVNFMLRKIMLMFFDIADWNNWKSYIKHFYDNYDDMNGLLLRVCE